LAGWEHLLEGLGRYLVPDTPGRSIPEIPYASLAVFVSSGICGRGIGLAAGAG